MTIRAFAAALLLLACGDDDGRIEPDASTDGGFDASREDAGEDAATEDASIHDAGEDDAALDGGAPGERIVFQRIPLDIGTPSGIYVATVDGSTVTRISPVGETHSAPRPSPDGSRIFYETDAGAWVMGADGGGASLVLEWSSIRERGFAWSRDGSKLIYLRDVRTVPDIASEVFVVTPGSSPVRLLPAGALGDPELSPDGARLVFTDGGDVWIANSNGSDPVAIATSPERLNQPTFSPDGARIAYHTGFVGGASGSLVVMDADGSNPQTVGSTGDAPEWSPDGSLIAYRSATGLRVVAPDGTGDRELATGSVAFHSWSPDGTRILFLDAGSIRVVRVADGDVTTVTSRENDTFPAWLPG